MGAALNLLYDFARVNPMRQKELVSSYVSILKQYVYMTAWLCLSALV